jgi:hypothetical protein
LYLSYVFGAVRVATFTLLALTVLWGSFQAAVMTDKF